MNVLIGRPFSEMNPQKMQETHRNRGFGCLGWVGVGGRTSPTAHHRLASTRRLRSRRVWRSIHQLRNYSVFVKIPSNSRGPGVIYLYAWEKRGRNEWSNISRMRTAMSFKFFRDMRGYDAVLKTNFCEQRFFGGVARGR